MGRVLGRILLRILVLPLFIAPVLSQAASQQPFDQKAFLAAQEAGKPIMIEIHADWCPTCKAQLPILDKLAAEPRFSNIIRLRVDYDAQKDAVKAFKARMQSTLIVFKGKTEVARSVGVTEEGKIRALFGKAL